ncbi:MAG: leucyl/phenylalanyl-tRNA--protein transferase [Chitinophagaceae bacterium]
MPLFALDKEIQFPPAYLADMDGLLAIGGDLSTERLLLAYREGIFPWYEGEHILWWSPDPRFVIFPEELKIRKSIRPLLNKNHFEFTVNTAFARVIGHCKNTPRQGQEGTWITNEVEKAFIRLHELGHAHSAEVWKDGELVGGLYGIRMGRVFFGESMFSLQPQASRYAFIRYVELMKQEGLALIDCQVYTEYLESLGARMISRADFLQKLKEYL